MNVSDFYESRGQEEIKSHIKSLFILAATDGDLHRKELKMIYSIGMEYGVPEEQLTQIFKEEGNASDYQKPQTVRKKIEHIFDLILVMMADGEMKRDELITAKKIAALMDISEKDFEEILDMMNELTLITHDKEEIVTHIENGMGHRI